MQAVEIILILIGLVFIMGSFFLPEKLSKKELDKIAELSEKEIQHIVDDKMSSAKSKIENDLDDALEEAYEKVLRVMEKDSNEKIMAINEYSDSVLDSISKTHNEVMFLYSMLNDKYDEMTAFAGQLGTLKQDIQEMEYNREYLAKTVTETETVQTTDSEPVVIDEDAEADEKELQKARNEKILALHLQGKTPVDIAKELEIGIGVVKLVLELYKGE